MKKLPKELFTQSANCTPKSSYAVFIENLWYAKNYKLNPVVSQVMYFAFEISGNIFSLVFNTIWGERVGKKSNATHFRKKGKNYLEPDL